MNILAERAKSRRIEKTNETKHMREWSAESKSAAEKIKIEIQTFGFG